MLFSSLIFLSLFLPLFLITYFSVKKLAARNFVLFIFSLVFYAWGEPVYILLMMFSLTFNYIMGLIIDRCGPGTPKCRAMLVITVVFDIGLLFVFKYTGFVVSLINGVSNAGFTIPQITLPIGISFYTFQIMSYVVDVYREKVQPQKNYIDLGAYLTAFPQLIAGPIVRYSDVAAELALREHTFEDAAVGIRRFCAGLCKKVLIANNVAVVADALFAADPSELGMAGAWLAAAAYALQIYYDFSGYSDMAIGLGSLMGFHYLENFNHPYAAVSVGDFWRRWHISLSTFFRDYVYIPMGGNRVGRGRWVVNMLTVWLLTGLWHGASLNFVVWGLYYGVILIAERLWFAELAQKHRAISRFLTLLAVTVGWVVFRADTLTGALSMYRSMVGFDGFAPAGLATLLQRSSFGMVFIAAAVAGIALSFPWKLKSFQNGSATAIRYAADALCVAGVLMCIISLAAGAYNPFIYFRF